jgi:hypothetical protein
MEQWFEFKDRKVGLAAALTRHPPTNLKTASNKALNQVSIAVSKWSYRTTSLQISWRCL